MLNVRTVLGLFALTAVTALGIGSVAWANEIRNPAAVQERGPLASLAPRWAKAPARGHSGTLVSQASTKMPEQYSPKGAQLGPVRILPHTPSVAPMGFRGSFSQINKNPNGN